MEMLVGLSLSFCVRDILAGKVDENDVAFISAATCARTQKDWDDVIDHYQRGYWFDNPVKGAAIARRFIDAGLVLQPRLERKAPVQTLGVSLWCKLSEYDRLARAAAKQGEL